VANLKVNPKKGVFFLRKLVYLLVTKDEGVQTDPEKVAAISNMEAPTNIKELRQ